MCSWATKSTVALWEKFGPKPVTKVYIAWARPTRSPRFVPFSLYRAFVVVNLSPGAGGRSKEKSPSGRSFLAQAHFAERESLRPACASVLSLETQSGKRRLCSRCQELLTTDRGPYGRVQTQSAQRSRWKGGVTMGRFEYKVIDTGQDIEARLNELGTDGWQVVGVTTKKQLLIAPPAAIILMRELEPAAARAA
jgi:hypothetical protein